MFSPPQGLKSNEKMPNCQNAEECLRRENTQLRKTIDIQRQEFEKTINEIDQNHKNINQQHIQQLQNLNELDQTHLINEIRKLND